MSSNDFLEFDDDSQTRESSSGRSPFVILAVVLFAILILASIFTVSLLNRRNQGPSEEAVARIATNEAISVANAAVTQTIAAMEAEALLPPTETPTPTPVAISDPTETPTVSPTDTPVAPTKVVEGENGDAGEGEATETGDAVVDAGTEQEATTETESTGEGDTTQTEQSTPNAAFDTTGTDSTLPQTGLETWTAVLLAVFFIGLVIASRRLRSS